MAYLGALSTVLCVVPLVASGTLRVVRPHGRTLVAAGLACGLLAGIASSAGASSSVAPRIESVTLGRAELPAKGGAVSLQARLSGGSTCWVMAPERIAVVRQHRGCAGGRFETVLRLQESDSLQTTRYHVTVWVQAGTGMKTRRTVVLQQKAHPPLHVSVSSKDALQVNASFEGQLLAKGGKGPYRWEVRSGKLPAGMTISTSGVIGGTPTVDGTFTAQVLVHDSSRPRAITTTIWLTFPVSGSPTSLPQPQPSPTSSLYVSPPSLPASVVNEAFSAALGATGGTGPYTWSVTSGAPPPGVTLSSDGQLSGTPTTSGTFSFVVEVTDSATPAQRATTSVEIVVSSATLTLTTPNVPQATAGSPFSLTLVAEGGIAPYFWAVTSGSLPPGLSLSAGGVLSGSPTTIGTWTCTVQLTDSTAPPQTVSTTITITVASAVGPLTITSTDLTATATGLSGAVLSGTAFSFQLGVSGGTAPYNWYLSGGAPSWVSITPSGATAVVSGVAPASPGSSYPVTVLVTDSSSPSELTREQLTLTVVS